MPSHHESDAPLAEAVLIRRAREARGLSPETAATRLPIRLSGRRWRQLEEGRDSSTGKPTVIGDAQLAHMAHVVGVAPEQLEEVDRGEAAEVLREIERQERRLAEVTVDEGAEIPDYVDLEHIEDWAREIWEKLLLLSVEDKEAAIATIRGIHRRAEQAVQRERGQSDIRRRTV